MVRKKKLVIMVIILVAIFILVAGSIFGLDYYKKKTVKILNSEMLQVSAQINSKDLNNKQLDNYIDDLEHITSNRLVTPSVSGQAEMFIAIARIKEQLNDLKEESNTLNSNFNSAVSSGNKDRINSAMNDIWSFSYRTTAPNSPILKSMQGMVVYGQFSFSKELVIKECIQPLFDNVNKYLKSIGEFN